MSSALACGCMGLLLAGLAAYAYSVLRDRRRPPAHDTIPGGLSDDEEDAFAALTGFQAAS